MQGYAINQKRLDSLNKTVEIESKIIAHLSEIDTEEILSVVNSYTNALDLLDDYDHQCVSKPEGNKTIVKLTTSECFKIIDGMKFGNSSNLLYLLVKDHPFNDGCKRIAAALFLTFLQKNGILKRTDGSRTISNGTLVAVTLLIAESRPEEKPIMISVVMNILGIN